MTKYVCAFVYDQTAERVALMRKARPEWMRGMLNGIGGHVEPGETMLQAMRREYREETGVFTGDQHWQLSVILNGHEFCVYFYRLRVDNIETVRGLLDEPVGIYPVRNLPDDVVPNLRWLVPLCADATLLPVTVQERA